MVRPVHAERHLRAADPPSSDPPPDQPSGARRPGLVVFLIGTTFAVAVGIAMVAGGGGLAGVGFLLGLANGIGITAAAVSRRDNS